MKTKADLIRENEALKDLLRLAVRDIEDIFMSADPDFDYICSKCDGFDVYTMCSKKPCEFRWRKQDAAETLIGKDRI